MFLSWLWHLRDVADMSGVRPWDRGQYRLNLLTGLVILAFQKVPEGIHENIVYRRSPAAFALANLSYPIDGCPILGGKTDRGPLSVIRNVLFTRQKSFRLTV